MKPIGIIANPSSGKDIRRLVAYGSVFNNTEKINIIKRVLKALDTFGVEQVYIMPDLSGLGYQAIDDVDISIDAQIIPIEIEGTQQDSIRAAEMMHDLDVACIITLGGDGTNRAVAKACKNVPILPISTGTNNVFPFMIEGTLAGMAAGIMACEFLSVDKACICAPRLEIYRDDSLLDIALIDLVITDDTFVGARAVWEPETIKEVFLTQARPTNIGFSALGGYLNPLPKNANKGLHIILGPGEKRVITPIAPGLICQLSIDSHRIIEPKEKVSIFHTPGVVALDGEREFNVSKGDHLSVSLNPSGPLVVDINSVLAKAANSGYFISKIQ